MPELEPQSEETLRYMAVRDFKVSITDLLPPEAPNIPRVVTYVQGPADLWTALSERNPAISDKIHAAREAELNKDDAEAQKQWRAAHHEFDKVVKNSEELHRLAACGAIKFCTSIEEARAIPGVKPAEIPTSGGIAIPTPPNRHKRSIKIDSWARNEQLRRARGAGNAAKIPGVPDDLTLEELQNTQ